jgi:hypothetical protein
LVEEAAETQINNDWMVPITVSENNILRFQIPVDNLIVREFL